MPPEHVDLTHVRDPLELARLMHEQGGEGMTVLTSLHEFSEAEYFEWRDKFMSLANDTTPDELREAREHVKRQFPPQPLTKRETAYLRGRGLLPLAVAPAGIVRRAIARTRAARRQPRRSRSRVTRGSPAGSVASPHSTSRDVVVLGLVFLVIVSLCEIVAWVTS